MLSYTDFSSAYETPEFQKKYDAEEAALRAESAAQYAKDEQRRKEWLDKQVLPYWEYNGVRIPWSIRNIPALDEENYCFYVEDLETGGYHVFHTDLLADVELSEDDYRKKYAKQAEDGYWWICPKTT